MKIFSLTLFLYLAIFVAGHSYAANTTLYTQYPANLGTYNKIYLKNLQIQPDCTQPSNAGLLFLDLSSQQLELCSIGQQLTIPYPETCFNRFWTGGGNTPPNGCGTINGISYVQATSGGSPLVTTFAPFGFTVSSTVCCSKGSVNGGAATSYVAPT